MEGNISSNIQFFKSLQENPVKTEESSPFTQRQYSEVIDIQFNSTGTKCAFSKLDKSIHVLGLSFEVVENSVRITKAHDKPVESLSFNPLKELQFCSVADDSTLKIWEIDAKCANYKLLRDIAVSAKMTRNFLCEYSPDGAYLAVVTKSNICYILDALDNYKVLIQYKESNNVYDFKWSNTSDFFLVAMSQGTLTINSLKKAHHHHSVRPMFEICRVHSIHSGILTSRFTQLCFNPRGGSFVTASQLGILQVFSTDTLTCQLAINVSDGPITCVDISRDGTYAIVCFESDESAAAPAARIYRLIDGREIHTIENCQNGKKTNAVAKFNPGKTSIVYSNGGVDGGVVFLHKRPQKRNVRI